MKTRWPGTVAFGGRTIRKEHCPILEPDRLTGADDLRRTSPVKASDNLKHDEPKPK